MVSRNRVVWREGAFIKPQHFQQQQRSLEGLLDLRLQGVSGYAHGFLELDINSEFLGFGRIALICARGVMPDGTAFDLPGDDLAPAPLVVEEAGIADQRVYLGLPLAGDGVAEVGEEDAPQADSRYRLHRRQIRDLHSHPGDVTEMAVARAAPRLLLERDDRSGYACLAVARIQARRPDGALVLDPHFIPTALTTRVVPGLQRFIGEVAGLMQTRARAIAQRLAAPQQAGVADVSDFMLLQLLNRLQPRFQHLLQHRRLHPETLYSHLLEACGELATFTDQSRLPSSHPAYDHDAPDAAFRALMQGLRQALSTVLEARAVAIPLEDHHYGLMVAPLNDRALLEHAQFIVAVHADLPVETLRRRFVQQVKVASIERIRDLVSLQLPGIPLTPLPVAPRQLPYHASHVYFQLDQRSETWEMLTGSGGFAFHLGGEFPGLDIQFWAIRS
ncbi:type VI secretion system protein ImpJ [Alkalispirillum mobile]|uniref:Type VI secretion system protein ImpJ n=1 Tax=Alkalispirillum mobile TaxID=85925 RepID=A0A498CHA6_9GAMM|nr:type VI secretion system baseplate subunit TssK [Alkalispirillum mobile]RLK51708.1 type VI secretion system protein ImpJ [Alkalispirillum mobile]